MNTFKKLSGLSAALLLTASMGTAYAEEADMTRAQTQDRTQLNLQTPNSEYGQAQNREQNKVMNKNQNQNKYQYKNSYRTGKNDTDESSMNRQNMTDRSNSMGGGTRSMGGSGGGRR